MLSGARCLCPFLEESTTRQPGRCHSGTALRLASLRSASTRPLTSQASEAALSRQGLSGVSSPTSSSAGANLCQGKRNRCRVRRRGSLFCRGLDSCGCQISSSRRTVALSKLHSHAMTLEASLLLLPSLSLSSSRSSHCSPCTAHQTSICRAHLQWMRAHFIPPLCRAIWFTQTATTWVSLPILSK
jgi:hypothetical protein